MWGRLAIAAVVLFAATPLRAEQLNAEMARRFVVGKLFAFNCFDGTRGAGRIYPDGSVSGSIQFNGSGPIRYAALPANTLQVQGEKVCASVHGIPFQPCFNVNRTTSESFRGSVLGLGFAYCDFTHSILRANFARNTPRKPTTKPQAADTAVATAPATAPAAVAEGE